MDSSGQGAGAWGFGVGCTGGREAVGLALWKSRTRGRHKGRLRPFGDCRRECRAGDEVVEAATVKFPSSLLRNNPDAVTLARRSPPANTAGGMNIIHIQLRLSIPNICQTLCEA